MRKEDITRDCIESVMKAKGYKYFEGGDYDVNIIGIRNSNTDGRVTNHYDDFITLSYKAEGEWVFHIWEATTDPGMHWIDNPLAKEGCAILVPGQYRGSHKIRLHRGKYEALGQKKKVSVYRDGDLDDVYDTDEETIQEGLFGINIHRSNPYRASTQIDKYSAGCQVFADPDDFDDFMGICKLARAKYGNSFSYTLLESKDL